MDGTKDVFGVQTIYWNDQAYTIPRPNLRNEGVMETALQRAYYETVMKSQKSYMEMDDYLRSQTIFSGWCNDGHWGYGKDGFMAALNNPRNMTEILHVVMMQDGQEQLEKGEILQMIKDKAQEAIDHNQALLDADPNVNPETFKNSEVIDVVRNWFKRNPTIPPGQGEKAKS